MNIFQIEKNIEGLMTNFDGKKPFYMINYQFTEQ